MVNIDITLPPPIQVDVVVASPLEVELINHATSLELTTAGPQGPGNLAVGPTNTLSAGTGLWIETGLGPDGNDFTFWIEDGT